MTCTFRYARFASVLALLCVVPVIYAQDSSPSAQTRPPEDASKKIGTNENIRSVRSGVPPAGEPGSDTSSSNDREFESSSNGATFINPKPGQVVHPGETFPVDLAIDPGVTLIGAAGIMSPIGFSDQAREAPPYSFTFTVPEKDSNGGTERLLGRHALFAMGDVAGRKKNSNEVPDLATTTIDVEEPGLPLSLVATQGGSVYGPFQIRFPAPGRDDFFAIYAKFSDGQELDVTHSSYLQLTSGDPGIVRVFDQDRAVSIASGNARIMATYTVGGQQKRLSIPVSVGQANSVLTASPTSIDFGDIPVGTTSPSRQVTVTNNSSNAVKIYGVSHAAGPENCSNTTLAPGASCTLTVSFYTNTRGPSYSTILIDNGPSIALIGNGI
jgi:hypothetical protein